MLSVLAMKTNVLFLRLVSSLFTTSLYYHLFPHTGIPIVAAIDNQNQIKL